MTNEMQFSLKRPLDKLSRALLPGILSFALTLFCLELIKISGQISPLWFPTTLMTMLIFRLPRSSLLVTLSGCFVGIVAANAVLQEPSAASFIFPLLNLLQAVMGGALLRILLDPKSPLDSLVSWSKVVLAVGVFTPMVSGLLATGILMISGHASFRFFSSWVISEMIGMLALGPVCLLWKNSYFRPAGHALTEMLLTLVATLVLSYISLRYLPWPFTFVVVVLFYSAVRLPRFEAFCLFLITVSMIALMLAQNVLEIQPNRLWPHASATWLPLLMALIPSHLMTLVMHSFREEKKHISESETRFRHAMEYSAIGMALVSPEGAWLQANKSLCLLLGYQEWELKKTSFQQLTHPEDLDGDLLKVNALLRGEIETYSIPKRYFHKNGQTVWARLTVSLVRDDERLPLYFISQIEDITDLKKTEEVNRRLMQRITMANEAGGIGVWELDLTSGRLNWDKRMFQLYGLPADGEACWFSWINRVLSADRQKAVDAVDHAIKTATPLDLEFRIETQQGVRFIRCQANLIFDEQAGVRRMLGINQDVTAMRQLTEALYEEKERIHITLEAIGEAVISTDEEMRVIFMNPVAESMTGWTQEKGAGKPISEILQITEGRQGPSLQSLLFGELPQSKSTPALEHELVLHNRAGQQYDIHYSITPLKTQDGEHIGSVMVIQDVSESRELMRRLSYSASHDRLTGLPNRLSFEYQLKTLLNSAVEQQQQHALVFIDLDRFKAVNDSAGHAAGDALLREISGVMQHHLRSSDFLARLGGDEFGVLLKSCAVEQAREVTQRLVNAVNDYRFLWEGGLHRVGASAGVTLISRDNHRASEVMRQADLACYNAKHQGRSQLSLYKA